jgi:hypothetical protein
MSRKRSPHPAPAPDANPSLAQHRARCRVCRHAQCEEIEREFLEWVNPREIASRWKFASYRAIYRHAQALGLFRKRVGHLTFALDQIIERVGGVNATAATVIAAIRLRLDIEMSDKQIRLRALSGERPASRYVPPAAPVVGVADDEDVEDGEDSADDDDGVLAESAPGEGRDGREGKKQAAAAGRVTGAEASVVAPESKTPAKLVPEAVARRESPGVVLERKPPQDQPPPEPDGPPMVAGMTWPWPPGKIQFSRRVRWRPGRG